jgi:DnaJ-class molecular chaperone
MFSFIRALFAACYNCIGDGTVSGVTCRRCGGSGIEPGT